MGDSEADIVGPIVERRKHVKQGNFLYRAGDKFRSVIAVVQGSAKFFLNCGEDREQVLGFCFPGETAGLGGMCGGTYLNDAQALENTLICEIPFDTLDQFALSVPKIQRELMRLLSWELVRGQDDILLLGKKRAEERFASFLLNVSRRYSRQQDYPGDHYTLTMSRIDIANFLGLTKETVSRLFHRFQKKNLLSVRSKHIQITNTELLKEIADGRQ